jgi:glycosyltransferase involved in cell wall biosynthesis
MNRRGSLFVAPRRINLLVSIAMASYNGAQFIREQLESFRTQARLPDELVVCDDGSSDGTAEIVEQFGETAPFAVRVERNPERLGYTKNFERAVSLCTGDIICLSDQDDSWFPHKLARVTSAMEASAEVLVLVNNQVIAGPDGEAIGVSVFANARKLGFPETYLSAGCCTSLRRTILGLLMPFPKDIPYDAWIGEFSSLLSAKRLCEEPLQLYRRHLGNVTNPIFAEKSPSLLGLIRRYGLSDVSDGWRQRLCLLALYEERIACHEGELQRLIGVQPIATARSAIASERQHLKMRLDLMAVPRPLRLLKIARLWRGGFYSKAFGWRSAVKDTLRG